MYIRKSAAKDFFQSPSELFFSSGLHLCLLGNFLLSADFFSKSTFLETFFQEYCPTVWIQIRHDILLGLIWVQIVCKGYPQRTLVGKELKYAKCVLIKTNTVFGLVQ